MGVNLRWTEEFVLFYRNSSLLRLLDIVKFLEFDQRGRKYEMAGYERREATMNVFVSIGLGTVAQNISL